MAAARETGDSKGNGREDGVVHENDMNNKLSTSVLSQNEHVR